MAEYTKSIRNILMVLLIMTIFFVLKTLAHLLIPLTLAGLLTMLSLPFIDLLRKWKIPRFLITVTVAFITIAILRIVIGMIGGIIDQIIQDRELLARQLYLRIDSVVSWIDKNLPVLDVNSLLDDFYQMLSPGKIASLIGALLGDLVSGFGSSILLFLLYYLFLLAGATGYSAYIKYVMGSDDSGTKKELHEQTQKSIADYMAVKTLVSLATGIMVGVICALFGLRFAFFWGFIAFIMNYIPSIGSFAATIFPFLMAVIQFDSFGTTLALVTALVSTQLIVGNIIDPMLMGDRLRFNPVSILFGLLFWGYIWGIPGMLLSVPFMVIIRLLLERHDDFAILARVMGYPDKPRRNPRFSLSKFIIQLSKRR